MRKLSSDRNIYTLVNTPNLPNKKKIELVQLAGFDNLKSFMDAHKNILSADELARITPQGYGSNLLSRKQNLQALGSEIKNYFTNTKASQMPKDVLKHMKSNLIGSGLTQGPGEIARYRKGTLAATALSSLPGITNALKSTDTTGQGRSQTERVFTELGGLAGGLASNLPGNVSKRLGMLGMPLQMGISMLGKKVGKAGGKFVGKNLDKVVSKARGVSAGDVTMQQKDNKGAI